MKNFERTLLLPGLESCYCIVSGVFSSKTVPAKFVDAINYFFKGSVCCSVFSVTVFFVRIWLSTLHTIASHTSRRHTVDELVYDFFLYKIACFGNTIETVCSVVSFDQLSVVPFFHDVSPFSDTFIVQR